MDMDALYLASVPVFLGEVVNAWATGRCAPLRSRKYDAAVLATESGLRSAATTLWQSAAGR